MKIDNLRPGQYLPTGQELPLPVNEAAKGVRPQKSPSGDSIELSNNTLLARDITSPNAPTDETSLLTPERLAEIRSRVGRGFYNSPAAEREAADKLIASFQGNHR